jgi:hypothetical protein
MRISKQELRKKFFFRLITQDKFYPFMCFPISVLKQLFYHKGRQEFFDYWINNQIDNIIVHIGINEADTILFMNVHSFEIKDHSVLINDKFKLYTPVPETNIKEELAADTLQKIAIDHIIPFKTILCKLQQQLPALRAIDKVLRTFNNDKGISKRSDLIGAEDYLVSKLKFDTQQMNNLEKDLNLLASKIQLQLMCSYYNLLKGDS